MFRLIIRQTNWSVLGAVFGFVIGFFIKIYLVNKVGLGAYGNYLIGQTLASTFDTLLALGIPFILIRFIPNLINKEKERARSLAAFSLRYSLVIGAVFALIIAVFSQEIATHVYQKDGIAFILSLMALYIPLSLYMGMITALYRSVLKVKEIIVYGTILSVSLRAIVTFIVFQFTDEIHYFVLIEVLTQLVVLSVLTINFHNKEMKLSNTTKLKPLEDRVIYDYGKQMFLNSIVMFLGGQSLAFLIGIYLPSSEVGAYGILITFANLTAFLLINLNRIFAPAISKLYAEKAYKELNQLYKKTTFIINAVTVPFAALIMLFSTEVLSLYGSEMSSYDTYLIALMLGSIISLAAGSSGTIMVMAGLEKKNLHLQLVKAAITIVLTVVLLPVYSFNAVVAIYIGFMLFLNISQLIYIQKHIQINPFSKELMLVYLLAIPIVLLALFNNYQFGLVAFVLIPTSYFSIYFLLLRKPLYELIKLMR